MQYTRLIAKFTSAGMRISNGRVMIVAPHMIESEAHIMKLDQIGVLPFNEHPPSKPLTLESYHPRNPHSGPRKHMFRGRFTIRWDLGTDEQQQG